MAIVSSFPRAGAAIAAAKKRVHRAAARNSHVPPQRDAPPQGCPCPCCRANRDRKRHERKGHKSGIADLTPLRGMPLQDIRLTPKNITQGMDILRDIKSLKTIGIEWDQAWPAAEFWERYRKGEFDK